MKSDTMLLVAGLALGISIGYLGARVAEEYRWVSPVRAEFLVGGASFQAAMSYCTEHDLVTMVTFDGADKVTAVMCKKQENRR